MLYVSSVGNKRYTITDSVSDESFDVEEVLEGYVLCFRYGNRYIDMRKVVGYLSIGRIYAVSKRDIEFLAYVDSVSFWFLDKLRDEWISISTRALESMSDNGVLVRITGNSCVHSVLDVVMKTSYDAKFGEKLESGVLTCGFGKIHIMEIKFCGDYMRYIAKFMTLYRNLNLDHLMLLG